MGLSLERASLMAWSRARSASNPGCPYSRVFQKHAKKSSAIQMGARSFVAPSMWSRPTFTWQNMSGVM
jgi:hypothetical protein